jgi:predicted transcriptional regulator
LRGVFYEPGIHRAKSQLKSLHENGYVSRIAEDEWEITNEGIEQIYRSVMGYRAQKERFLGKRYVANVNNQIVKIRRKESIAQFDEEEKILVAVEDRMKQVRKKRSNQRARHRSRH